MYFDHAPDPFGGRLPPRKAVDADALREYVNRMSLWYGYAPAAVRGRGHDRRLVAIRRTIATDLRAQRYSYPAIGRALGRDHSTIVVLLQGGNGKAARAARLAARRSRDEKVGVSVVGDVYVEPPRDNAA